jgi:capsule polysaccharide export protein KpsE/RkpR
VVAAACGVGLLLSLAISLLLAKRYTATASVLIEAPGGNDVRVATAVSAVYLESLKTYESFAASDSVFARAVEEFHLQEGGSAPSLEALKRRVLKVSKPRDTKVLEISVTLPRPKQAQAVAEYLADQTVGISRTESMAADNAFTEEAQKQVTEAHARLDERQKEWANLAAAAPVQGLQNTVESSIDFQSQLRRQLVEAEANVAEYQQQTQAGGQFAQEQLPSAQARAALIEKRLGELNREIQEKSALLATRIAKREAVDSELKMAQTAYEAASARLRDIRSAAGSRGEQLRVIDPGIVPQAPSSPNVLLNVAAALLVAVVSSFVYLSIAFVYRRRAIGFQPTLSRGMRA